VFFRTDHLFGFHLDDLHVDSPSTIDLPSFHFDVGFLNITVKAA
jgi:hypothetical protein